MPDQARMTDKADRLVSGLENLEERLSAAIVDAEALRSALDLVEEPDWPDYDPAVYRQLRETVRQLRETTSDGAIRLDLDRIDRVLAAAGDS